MNLRPLLKAVTLLGALVAVPVRGAEEPPQRTLYLLLDAVPYSLVAELTDPDREGGPLLPGMSRPVPLVSSFPSSTSVAAGGILEAAGLEPSPGYEARFFDWSLSKARGGGPISYFKIDFPWREFFDFELKGAFRTAFGALRPVRGSVFRIDRAFEAFFRSDRRDFFAYVEATDTAIHLKGPRSMLPVLEALQRELDARRRRHPGQRYRVVVFSDHGISGGEPLVNVWKPARRALETAGFRLRQRLQAPRDLVLTPFGLVSSFEAYVAPGLGREVASVLAQVPGVDLCALPEGEDAWWIDSRRGAAHVLRSGPPGAERWQYRPDTGDPLGYAEIVATLRRETGDPARDRFADVSWFAATVGGSYPDALYRIARGFELVVNPASVLCSLEPGHMYGADRTEVLARLRSGRLRWTHGALHREPSLGFLMTDDPDWTPTGAVRFDRALLPFLGRSEETP